jgi:hypothetical protein
MVAELGARNDAHFSSRRATTIKYTGQSAGSQTMAAHSKKIIAEVLSNLHQYFGQRFRRIEHHAMALLRTIGVSSCDFAAKRCRRRVRLRRAVWRKCSCAVPLFWTQWIDAVTRNKRADRPASTPKAWWQRVYAGEPLPKDWFKQKSKCGGTVEDFRNIALDARELIRHRVFEQPVARYFTSTCAFLGCA